MRIPRCSRFLLAAILAAGLLATPPSPARAATVRAMDLSALAAAADLVVRGIVGSQSCRVTDAGRIVTDSVVHVDETLAGVAGGDTVVVTTLGGEVGNQGQRVPGSPELRPGDEVLLFLHRFGPPSQLSRTQVVGLFQGAFHVVRTSGTARLQRQVDGLVLGGYDIPVPGDLDTLRGLLPTLASPDPSAPPPQPGFPPDVAPEVVR